MLNGKRLLAVVPARGGSKGIPLKNLRPLDGVPLVARVGQLVRALGWLDRAVVSTDHSEIARVAVAAGLDAPFVRPPALSGDRIGDLEVLTHVLEETERIDGLRYDVVVMLQPTSPLRRPEHVTAAVSRLIDGGWDTVWTVSPTESKGHPWKQLTLEDGVADLWDPRGRAIIARQQLVPVYHRNGAAYAFTRECLLEQRTIMGKRWSAVVIDEPMVSIDTVFDLDYAEWLLARAGRDA
jgi:CMP-N-acetylneuraminic acid synthetase